MTNPKLLRSIGKIMAAIAAATVVACATALLAGFAFVTATWREGSGWLSTSLTVGGMAAYFTLIVCPLMFLIVGLPLYAFSVRQGWVSARAYATVGVAVSCVAAVAWLAFGPSMPPQDLTVPLLIFGGTGATLAFWRVLRPDR